MGGYKVYLPETDEFIVSTHVTFGKSPNRTRNTIESEETVDTQSDSLNVQQVMIDHLNAVLQKHIDTMALPNITEQSQESPVDTPQDIVPLSDM